MNLKNTPKSWLIAIVIAFSFGVACVAVLFALSVKSKHYNDNSILFDSEIQVESEISQQPDSLKLVEYGETFSDSYFSGPYKIARYFGWENGQIEDGSLPNITGMVYRTGLGRHIGLRCPNERTSLEWTSDRLRRFADWCKNGPSDTIPERTPLYRKARSYQDICEHYISEVVSSDFIRTEPCDTSSFIEQFAILLVDIYRGDRFITMQEYTWYDCNSCGDNTALSWFTIERKTGRQLSLCDIIDESKLQDFAYIMIRHLTDVGNSPWFDYARELRYCDLVDYLKDCDGIAIVPEGVVVYYHPYKIGCGAEGQYNSLIPYDELEGMLKCTIEQ